VLEKQPTVQVRKDETGAKQPASRNGGEERAAGTGDGRNYRTEGTDSGARGGGSEPLVPQPETGGRVGQPRK
jgi:hypothetical protein